MLEIIGLTENLEIFLLVLVRMTGLFIIAPVFGRRNVPAYLKTGFSLFMAVIVVNTLEIQGIEADSLLIYGVYILKELVIGLTLGYVSYLILNAIYVAGQLIDMQIGFGMVNVIDPMSNIQIPITANFYFIISILVFISVNGHHMLIKALIDSFSILPLGRAVINGVLVNNMAEVFGSVFVTAFKISAPITAAILIINVALGVLSKAVPQLNVFIVGMPLKIFIGIVVMMVTIPVFISLLENLFRGTETMMLNFVREMAQ